MPRIKKPDLNKIDAEKKAQSQKEFKNLRVMQGQRILPPNPRGILKLVTGILILVLLYYPLKSHADGDSPAMVEALQAADLNYQQDHDNKIIQEQQDQIRALQDQIQSQDD